MSNSATYLDVAGDEPACRICQCTENQACPGGCYWVPDPLQAGELCSACLELAEAQAAGLACVVCVTMFRPSSVSKPVDDGPRGQLFACVEPCVDTWNRTSGRPETVKP